MAIAGHKIVTGRVLAPPALLQPKDRNDPLTEMIAKKIIEIGQTGVKEPASLMRTDRGAFRPAPR